MKYLKYYLFGIMVIVVFQSVFRVKIY
jgi:hypothetical protein